MAWRAVEMHGSAARRRVEAALAGTLAMAQLAADEAVVVNAEIDAAIQERVRVISFGQQLAAEGVTTVALDEHGKLVRSYPDGTLAPLADPLEPRA